jgi:HSP20 family molecular chaperone IbpA
MRYRRLSYRYVVQSGETGLFGEIWQSDRLRLLVQTRWRPDADMYETSSAIEVTVDLAGVSEDDFEVQVFEDVVVVEGR